MTPFFYALQETNPLVKADSSRSEQYLTKVERSKVQTQQRKQMGEKTYTVLKYSKFDRSRDGLIEKSINNNDPLEQKINLLEQIKQAKST